MKYRNEWKYIVKKYEIDLITNKLNRILNLDNHIKNETYFVHSIYFDDYNNNCYLDNESGIGKRFKWRIRYYNNDLLFIILEKKIKNNGLTKKLQCPVSLEQYRMIMDGDVSSLFWQTNEDLLKIFCVDIMTKKYKPKIIIDYERCAFVEPISNIRITFDRNIVASKDIDKFITGDYTRIPIQNINESIMEVKFDDILPSHIKQATYLKSLKQTTFSKYYLSRTILERS